MATTLEVFREVAPEFASVTDALVNVYLELAVAAHATSGWGGVYQYALSFYAAHLLKTVGNLAGGSPSSSTGALVSQKDGDLSRTYKALTTSGASVVVQALSQTQYGLQYLTLRNTRAAVGPFAVTVSTDRS